MTAFEELLPLIDRVVSPIIDRIGRMEGKLDDALKHSEQIAVHAAEQIRINARLAELEDSDADKTVALAKAEGRNAIINWILGLIGAPLVVALAGTGIAKLAGWI